MTITLRKFLTDEGEPLLTPVGPFDAAVRLQRFHEATGIDIGGIVTSPLSGLPVPVYPAQLPDGRRRWPGLRPEAMWHPLMWLPKTVRARRFVAVGNDQPTIEDNDLWVARVMVELSTAAKYDEDLDQWIPLYDEASGGWVDILALHGLDIETTEVQDRVAAWLDGAPDTDLDAIDLAGCFDTDEQMPDWSVVYAWNAIGILLPAAYAVYAHALAGHIEDILGSPDVDAETLATTFRLVASIAAGSFTEVDGEPEWWTAVADAWDGSVEQLTGRILPSALTRLNRLADSMETMSDQMQAESDAAAANLEDAPPASQVQHTQAGPDWAGLEQAW